MSETLWKILYVIDNLGPLAWEMWPVAAIFGVAVMAVACFARRFSKGPVSG